MNIVNLKVLKLHFNKKTFYNLDISLRLYYNHFSSRIDKVLKKEK